MQPIPLENQFMSSLVVSCVQKIDSRCIYSVSSPIYKGSIVIFRDGATVKWKISTGWDILPKQYTINEQQFLTRIIQKTEQLVKEKLLEKNSTF